VAPSAEYGTANVVDVIDYVADDGAEVIPTLVGTGVVKDPGTGLFDNKASGSQFKILAGIDEFLDIDINSGKLIISGNIESDIVDKDIVVEMVNGYYESVQVPVKLSITLKP
jgi:hypothetical protein